MSPPPSTPMPKRFLLPKRGTQSSQTPATLPRFQSTPRFASSVPRPTQARTGIDIEDVEEVGDNSQETLSESDEHQIQLRKHDSIHDSIEIESDDATASQGGSIAISDNEPDAVLQGSLDLEMSNSTPSPYDFPSLEEREPKRRRVSSSHRRESSTPKEQRNPGNESPEEVYESGRTPSEGSTQSIQDAINLNNELKPLQQPTFHAPPRFKPVDLDPAVDGLPAAFSPQRRGAKYIAGGLAAELQGWLSEVKGWEGTAPATTLTKKVIIEEIQPGRRMYLVKARTGTSEESRYLLAGEGRLTGLGQRMPVILGSVVDVGQPVWDIVLDGQVWTVACDWGISESGNNGKMKNLSAV
ncbi:hypothetical protein Forpe1208_v007567 [Fusarium oxysporum f. sp. rapae]|uniref:Uncharacterized protein n=1 Tax=Fusarium oxysporum f. sp. rapae TaxID=485398 RepID=A0A8J5TTE9_FUSOX|nr:hypothetical protein Forpe1208_v007567 [Fusarium oxysporum f. sp. rapae]